MKIDFSGRSALITGGTRGIGASIARRMLEAGASVTVTGTAESSKDSVRDLLSEFGSRLNCRVVDFSNRSKAEEFAASVGSEHWDIVVNNAGINKIAKLAEIAVEDWDRIQEVNLRAPFLISRAVVGGMAKRGYGRVVNISSVFGLVSKAQRASYSTSKFGLLGLTKAMALDYGARGVLVNALAPGFIDTELTREILNEEQRREMVAQVPLGRLGRPEEIADFAVFLASERNSFMTGQLVVVDGGFTSA